MVEWYSAMVTGHKSYIIRPMHRDDIPQVTTIDREAFPTQWPPPPFKRDLESKTVRYLVALEDTGSPGPPVPDANDTATGTVSRIVARIRNLLGRGSTGRAISGNPDSVIVGYAALWLVVDEAHLTSIAVDQCRRGRGVGELLLISSIDLAAQLKARVVTLETRVSNTPAQTLYEKYGFAKVGLRHRYYSDNGEDAFIMTTDDLTCAEYQARLCRLRQSHLDKWGTPHGVRLS